MSNHAIYSPSSSEIWMNCPGSVPRKEFLSASDNEGNIYTSSGSVIHALGEELLRAVFISNIDYRPILDRFIKTKWGDWCELPAEFAVLPVDQDMIAQAEVYLAAARDMIDPGDEVFIEVRMKHSEELYGTADLIVRKDDRLIVCDLKTGAGNIVHPKENKQLMTYAGMALDTIGVKGIEAIELVIVQPPDEDCPVKFWPTTPEDINQHMAKVQIAMEADHIQPGLHCKWCPVRASCPELHELAVGAASLDLDGLTPDGWKDALELAAILKPWCESVYQRANQLANENGLAIPGYKLVTKMGRKTWASEKEAEFAITELLDEADVDLMETPEIWNPAKLRTPLQVQKACKGLVEPEKIEELTTVPVRGTILVPNSDKRDSVETGENLLAAAENLKFFLP